MNKLEDILTKQGRSKTWLAGKMGVTYKTVLNWCRGRTPMNKWKVDAIATHLNVEPNEITNEAKV